MEIIRFIFSDFWIWAGTVILLGILTQVRLFTIEINKCEEQPHE